MAKHSVEVKLNAVLYYLENDRIKVKLKGLSPVQYRIRSSAVGF